MTLWSCALFEGIYLHLANSDALLLKRPPRKVMRRPLDRDRGSQTDELVGDDGPDEAVTYIAETLPALVKLARSHDLDLIAHLLGMTLMEAEEHLRLRSKHKLS